MSKSRKVHIKRICHSVVEGSPRALPMLSYRSNGFYFSFFTQSMQEGGGKFTETPHQNGFVRSFVAFMPAATCICVI